MKLKILKFVERKVERGVREDGARYWHAYASIPVGVEGDDGFKVAETSAISMSVQDDSWRVLPDVVIGEVVA